MPWVVLFGFKASPKSRHREGGSPGPGFEPKGGRGWALGPSPDPRELGKRKVTTLPSRVRTVQAFI